MVKKILFLINPISGVGRQNVVEKCIDKVLDKKVLSVDVAYTCYKAHARELAGDAVGKYDAVVAVGGDGTVNEIASKLIGTNTALAIIPTGSGNGLARHLHIPLKVSKAIQSLNYFRVKKIDSIKLNQYCCVNVAGVGFDAHISHLFEGKKLRGPLGYFQLIVAEYAHYQSEDYCLKIDGNVYKRKAFLVNFANSSQYGNNIYIAPNAKNDDGLIDVSIIHDFPKIYIPNIVLGLLDKTIDKNENDEVVKAKVISIEHPTEIKAHIDGEPVVLGKKVAIQILPSSLNVIIPPDHLEETNIFEPLLDVIPKLKEGVPLEQIWKSFYKKKEN